MTLVAIILVIIIEFDLSPLWFFSFLFIYVLDTLFHQKAGARLFREKINKIKSDLSKGYKDG